MIFRMLQKLQEFDFQVVHCPGGKNGNADELSRECSQAPELTEEEKKEMFGDNQPADNLSDALGHIQMVTSPEPHPGSSTDVKITHARNRIGIAIQSLNHSATLFLTHALTPETQMAKNSNVHQT